MHLALASGFKFDYTNLFGEGKVTEDDVRELRPVIEKAHAAVMHMRETGEVRGHLSKDGMPEKVLFSKLPYVSDGNLNSPESIARLKKFGEKVHDEADVVVSFGIGGSYLGGRVLFDTSCGEFWNLRTKKQRGGWPEFWFSGNNIDPQRTKDLLEHIRFSAEKKRTHEGGRLTVFLIVISKSGSTFDTMSAFMVVLDELRKSENIDVRVVAVTDPSTEKPTLLKKLAEEQGWEAFAVPDGVGGRVSVFSEVGLTAAVCFGYDIEAFLAGARGMDEACRTPELFENPAMLNAVLKFLASEKHGRDIEVLMPYGDYLKSLSEWYIQLLAESLGKTYNRRGEKVYYGRTPIVAVGTTDMHAQTQQHQEGRLNKVVQFVRVEKWKNDFEIPNVFPSVEKLASFSGAAMSSALETAREANEEALSGNHRFNALFSMPELTPYHLGELMYLLALSVAYEGELADVDAFDQPGVEVYKKIMGPRIAALGRKPSEG